MYPRNVPYESSPPRRHNIITVGMPGVTSTRSQMSRYTGGDPVTVLENWADSSDSDLAVLDKGKNRYACMSLYQRVTRMVRLFGSIVLGRKGSGTDEAAEVEDVCVMTMESEGVQVTTISGSPPSSTTTSASSLSQRHGKSTASTASHLSTGLTDTPYLSTADTTRLTSPVASAAVLAAADEGRLDPPVLYTATCRIAPRLLHGILASPEVPEIRHRRWYATLNPLHWMLVAKELATCWWFSVRPYQFCYSEPGRSNMAGLRDQAAFTREVRRAIHKIDTAAAAGAGAVSTIREENHGEGRSDGTVIAPRKQHLVLFGVSRGATTCFYSAMKLAAHEARRVSLVLVEAPFDTLEHVLTASAMSPRLLRWFFCACCDWRGDADEAAAYDYDPAAVQLRCPVAFVMSVKDSRVPNACTQALVDRLRRELVPHVISAVEVLVLHHSRHPCMAVGHKADQDAYVAFVEGLYNQYCAD